MTNYVVFAPKADGSLNRLGEVIADNAERAVQKITDQQYNPPDDLRGVSSNKYTDTDFVAVARNNLNSFVASGGRSSGGFF